MCGGDEGAAASSAAEHVTSEARGIRQDERRLPSADPDGWIPVVEGGDRDLRPQAKVSSSRVKWGGAAFSADHFEGALGGKLSDEFNRSCPWSSTMCRDLEPPEVGFLQMHRSSDGCGDLHPLASSRSASNLALSLWNHRQEISPERPCNLEVELVVESGTIVASIFGEDLRQPVNLTGLPSHQQPVKLIETDQNNVHAGHQFLRQSQELSLESSRIGQEQSVAAGDKQQHRALAMCTQQLWNPAVSHCPPEARALPNSVHQVCLE